MALLMAIDLAPTLLDLAGIPVPLRMQGQAFLGDHAGPPRAEQVEKLAYKTLAEVKKQDSWIREGSPEWPSQRPRRASADSGSRVAT